MYQNYYARGYNDDRFIVPFLLGGLAGGAAVGLSRPRPVYVNRPNYQPYPPMYGPYPMSYGYSYGYNYGGNY